MNQPVRKPGELPGGKVAEALPVDDPSIPVLTERLTLPPLDLNLDFRLPDLPAKTDDETLVSIAPPSVAPALAPVDRTGTSAPDPLLRPIHPVMEPQAPQHPVDLPPLDERTAVAMAGNTLVEPEATDFAPRVPTSLLLSNVDALLPTPQTGSYREADEFDLTQSDGAPSNRMESNLREMILLELARRLPTEVEAIVRRHLDGAIEDAIRRFTVEVRIALAGSLREMVDRAVKAELDRLNVPRN